MSELEKLRQVVIEKARAYVYHDTDVDYHNDLFDAVMEMEEAEKAQASEPAPILADHPFQPHHLHGSDIQPWTDYCTEAVRDGRWWRTCALPRSGHPS